MPVSGNTFDDQSVEQIRDTVTWVKQARRPTFNPRRGQAGAGVTELFEAMVTDGTPDGDGHYEAVIVQWDQADLGYDTFDEVRLRVNSGETLTVNKVYGCRPSADATDDGFRLYDVLRGVELPTPTATIQIRQGSSGSEYTGSAISQLYIGSDDSTEGGLQVRQFMSFANIATLRAVYADDGVDGILDASNPNQKISQNKIFMSPPSISSIVYLYGDVGAQTDPPGYDGFLQVVAPLAPATPSISVDLGGTAASGGPTPAQLSLVSYNGDSRPYFYFTNVGGSDLRPDVKIKTDAVAGTATGQTGTYGGLEFTSGWLTGGSLTSTPDDAQQILAGQVFWSG